MIHKKRSIMKWLLLTCSLLFANSDLIGHWKFDEKSLEPLFQQLKASVKDTNMLQLQLAMVKQQVSNIYLDIQKEKMIFHSPMGVDSISQGANSWKNDTLEVKREGKVFKAIHQKNAITIIGDGMPMPVILKKK